VLLLLFSSCRQEADTIVYQPQRHWVERTVAVVAPLGDAATKERLERTAQWFLDNFREAQLNDTLAVTLKLEWYDEQNEDMAALSRRLAADTTLTAIVGPFANEDVAIFAAACQPTLKPLIAPTATSEEVIRRYAVSNAGSASQFNKKPFLWALTETDVAFTDVLMSGYSTEVQYYSGVMRAEAAVFAPEGVYGQTFNYWAPFYAENDGISLLRNEQYAGTADLATRLKSHMDEVHKTSGAGTTATFCVVESAQQLYDVARLRRQWFAADETFSLILPSTDPDDPANDEQWQMFANTMQTYFAFNDISDDISDIIGERGATLLQGYQGFSPYADPTTGFETSYRAKFGQSPTFAECKFYDALMLAAFAACYAEHNDLEAVMTRNESTIASIIYLTSVFNENAALTAWAPTPMAQYLKAIEDHRSEQYTFRGASGAIRFDLETYTTATSTTYLHWQILDGQVIHRGYFGDVGSDNVASANAAWKYIYDEREAIESFSEMATESTFPQYSPLTDCYAVLVQGSDGLTNYRHQADVLSVYQLLRRGGMDDEHIILIIDRALASDPENPEQGIIRNSAFGPDLLGGTDAAEGYPAAVVDYDAADLTPADIANTLLSQKTNRTPAVLPSDARQNVLFYWSGHGRSKAAGGADELVWRDNAAGLGFTSDLMRETVSRMQAEGRYRKMFIVTEPCFSENVIRRVEGIPGVLAISGASGSEQSWAENWNPSMGRWGTWMCDRFTRNVVNCLTADPTTSYRDLYLYCTRNTIGSHVKIVNAAHFGNLYASSPLEFITVEN
jgi:glycosylphosphatidylinositol transamidase (GPIT) subunit GPI8